MKGRSIEPSAVPEQVVAHAGSPSMAPLISVPWGSDGSLDLAFPLDGLFTRAEIEVVWPDLSNPLADYPGAFEQALDSPVGMEKLEQMVRPGARVAIVVDDPSRWTPVREALPIVLQRLHTVGIGREDVTISIGVGRHHPIDANAMRQRLGDVIATDYHCYSPPVDDLTAYVDLGSTPQGVPVRVFQPVAQADLRILIGSVLPHLQAGFGGGYKLILPGTSHRTTLGSLHRQGLGSMSAPAGLLGSNAVGNPMRQAIHEAAKRLGPCFSISHLIGRKEQVFHIAVGDPSCVQDLLAGEVSRRFQAPPSTQADLIVAGNHPWPGDPMQSFKVLLQHRAACRPGGVLVGLFWTAPGEIARSLPISVLRRIATTGALGGWTIRRLLPATQRIVAATGSPAAFMLRWACELVVDRTVLVYAPPLYERLGHRLGPVRLFSDQSELWNATAVALNRRHQPTNPLRVRVFPHGGLTYVTGATPHVQ
jgi:lactate racemase